MNILKLKNKTKFILHKHTVPRKYLPPVIHHYRTGSVLVAIQILLGSLLLALALHLLLWSPQLNIRDVPHWSGISVSIIISPLKKRKRTLILTKSFYSNFFDWLLHLLQPNADTTAAIIRFLWPVSFVLLPEAVSRDERRLLRLRCPRAVYRKFLSRLYLALLCCGARKGEYTAMTRKMQKRKFEKR